MERMSRHVAPVFDIEHDRRELRGSDIAQQFVVIDPENRHLFGNPDAENLADFGDLQRKLVVTGKQTHRFRQRKQPLSQ